MGRLRKMWVDSKRYFQAISAIGKEAMKEKKAQGECMHLAPLGYRNVHIKGRSVIERDPKIWPLVEEAKSLSQHGLSIRAVCQIMAEKGLRSQRGKIIGPSSMLKILQRHGDSNLDERTAH